MGNQEFDIQPVSGRLNQDLVKRFDDPRLGEVVGRFVLGEPIELLDTMSRLDISQRQTVLANIFGHLAETLNSGETTPYHFSKLFQRVMLLDERRQGEGGFALTKRWLQTLQENDFKTFSQVTETLPTEVIGKKLEMFDLETCGPKRMAKYILRFCNKVVYSKEKYQEFRDDPSSGDVARVTVSFWETQLCDVLAVLSERIDEGEEELLIGVAKNLSRGKYKDEVPIYVLEGLWQVVEQRGNELAEDLIHVINGDGYSWGQSLMTQAMLWGE